MKVLIIIVCLFLISGCTVLHTSITIDETSTFNRSFGYTHDNELYGINFSAAKDTLFLQRPKIGDRKYNPNNLSIYLGQDKSELENFPIKPKKIKNKKKDGIEYEIFKYVAYKSLVEHMNVYIKNGKVVKMKGLIFRDMP